MTQEDLTQLQEISQDRFRANLRLQEWLRNKVVESMEKPGSRTGQQNKSLWKFFGLVSDALTAKGVTMRKIFDKTAYFDIPPTKDNVHDLWIYFQKIMYKTDSTKLLKKTEQIDKLHAVVMKNLGELFEIEYIDFPHDKAKAEDNLKSYKLSATEVKDHLAEYYEKEDVGVKF